jgi:hypothetical protein
LYRRHAPLTQAKAKADCQIAPEAKATAQAGDQLENERTFPDGPEGHTPIAVINCLGSV